MKNVKKLFAYIFILFCIFSNMLNANAEEFCNVQAAQQVAKILYHETGFNNFVGDPDEHFFTELVTAGVILNNANVKEGSTLYKKLLSLSSGTYEGYSNYRDIPFEKDVSPKRQSELLYVAELILTGKFSLPSNMRGQSSCACLLGTRSCRGVDIYLDEVNCKDAEGWGVYWTHVESLSDNLFDVYFGYSKYEKLSNVDVFGNSIKSISPDYYRDLAKKFRLSDYSAYTSKTVCNGLSDADYYNNKNKVPTSSIFLIRDVCRNPDILKIIRFILVLIDVAKYVIPMGLIVYGAIDLAKATFSSDEKIQKTNFDLFIKRLINAIVLFLIPGIVEFLIVFLGDIVGAVNFTDCIKNANKDKIAELQAELDIKREELEKVNKNERFYDYNVYIGDSRTVGMCSDVKLSENENCELAKSGMGYSWLTSNDVKTNLDKILKENPNSYVVINMGTNSGLSTDEGKEYANYYNELSKKYPTSKIVAVSVTQVIPELAKKNGLYAHISLDSNSVNNFNKGLKNNLNSNVKYCDAYSSLEKRGYNTPDGVHYAKETNEVIYEEIQKCLK